MFSQALKKETFSLVFSYQPVLNLCPYPLSFKSMSCRLNFHCFISVKKTVLIGFLAAFVFCTNATAQTPPAVTRPVDVVFAIDLSGSTNGLLDNLRDKMWDIINQWKMYKPEPRLRIGIIGFSRLSFADGSGYTKVICDLTDDYDYISSELFAIKPYVENGYQFIGAAISTGITDMSWSENANTLKMMYVIGNGRADLGLIHFRNACEQATNMNITINTIYCNKHTRNQREKEITAWTSIAELTGGKQYDIYVTKRAPLFHVSASLNKLMALSDTLNKTYICYGKNGRQRFDYMQQADKNAGAVFESYLYSRLYYKLSKQYALKSIAWDMVSYKQTYPESQLAAIKAGVKKDGNTTANVNLDSFVNKYLDARTNILSEITKYFPVNEQQRVHKEIAEEDFDISAMLDRVLLVSFRETALKAGFED